MTMNHIAFISPKTRFKSSVCILPISQSNDLVMQINLNCEVN